ncbi:MAG: LPS O-antigen chain length determinant protein WzzB [Gammaproteobacteria bacterium]|nr:LPS O-antigen chain length determinant protein WzzB [Gammaproteobacteria bacterium]
MAENMPKNPAPAYAEDEIDLLELWNSLWEQKWLIAGITAFISAGGLAYALLATPTYKAESYFLPPLQQDVEALNMQGAKNITVAAVYQAFLQNLQSRALRREFYQANQIESVLSNGESVARPEVLFEKEFNKRLVLDVPKKGNIDFTSLSFEFRNPEQSAMWVNAFVAFVAKKTRDDLVMNVRVSIESDIKVVKEQIDAKRALAKERRFDRIAMLREALAIAESVGLRKPMIDQAANNLSMEYMRGADAIKAEIVTLEARQSDDPFIEGIRDLEERLNYLKVSQVDADKVRVVRVDQPASVPDSPIKPNKSLIVAVSLVLGLMLGVFIALIRQAVKKRKVGVPDA